uniref:Methyltransferase domain-containing protein n=1 Tax=Candidatus Kentrum sp. SD TaxID=2126332 RepID=A0A451BI91_9GAMM|nr:MAG: hypothetical protein BECKSD772D_GA0070982_100466 [Candidatus Kentron sp. SD]
MRISILTKRLLHLDEDKLEPESTDSRCPFCSSTNRQRVYILQENPDICLLQCNVCHAVSASRIPTDETLADYYSGFYESSELREYFGEKTNITFSKPQRLAVKLCKIYRSYCQDNSSVAILDFGGGDGTISNFVAMNLINSGIKKVNITIVDYNKKRLFRKICG